MEKVSRNTVNKQTKWTWTNRKWKNIKAQLELEPNFPGVATPQSSERIIYIISYANNPFTALLGVMEEEFRGILLLPELLGANIRVNPSL